MKELQAVNVSAEYVAIYRLIDRDDDQLPYLVCTVDTATCCLKQSRVDFPLVPYLLHVKSNHSSSPQAPFSPP